MANDLPLVASEIQRLYKLGINIGTDPPCTLSEFIFLDFEVFFSLSYLYFGSASSNTVAIIQNEKPL